MNKLVYIISVSLLMVSCGKDFEKSPIDELIIQLDNEPTYTILLFDMDIESGFKNKYKHKYKIITERNEIPQERKTGWKKTSKEFFLKNQNNLGMELVSKGADGKINKVPAPPGYSNYVGNEKYGQWSNRNGSSFWEFYGKYAMISTLFNLGRSPIQYGHYQDYTGNYRGSRPYYGNRNANGTYSYGTNSNHSRRSSPNYFQRRQAKTGWKSSSARSSSSSSRSRSGSFGK